MMSMYTTRYDVSVWIRQIGPISLNSLVNIKYKIYAKKDFIYVDIAKSATYKLENQKRLGQTSIKLDKVVGSDGHLKLFCEIEMDCYNLNNNLPYTNIDMLNEEILTDFVIKVDDEVIKTHKCILAKNSKVFHRMFEQNGMTEAQNGEVILTDTTPECVRAMLEFFYTGMVSDDKMQSHVDDIFAISHKYQVELLKCLCERFMCSNIDSESMVKCCEIINLYGAQTLEKACTDYIRFNGKSFLKSKEWEEIKNNYPNLFYRFLENIVENLGN
uniref:BTB domain-containing protein n=1 Tax=Meloidogyne enterolobii TaxID=390850 RepID=A0A6V7U3G6_MELEN|nr:unnamed protein product [Meloidogyne enterolobii]